MKNFISILLNNLIRIVYNELCSQLVILTVVERKKGLLQNVIACKKSVQ